MCPPLRAEGKPTPTPFGRPLKGAALADRQSRIRGAQDQTKHAVLRTENGDPDHDTVDPAPPVHRRRPPGGRA